MLTSGSRGGAKDEERGVHVNADEKTGRAGRLARQQAGYVAFEPALLPPRPPVHLDAARLRRLSKADQGLGGLRVLSGQLPNPDLFVAMYVRREAVLSSQIEGTQASLTDVLQFEMAPTGAESPRDVGEVVNYVAAMNHGLALLRRLPLGLAVIREVHERLMSGVRGGEKSPGRFRTTQNWLGPRGATLDTATFVPPPPRLVPELMTNLETFLHESELPDLVNAAITHAQFETIHPFLDGNGRTGRLLIALQLCERLILRRPLLYLSRYLKQHRAEYYARLNAVRAGEWEEWIAFFLAGVEETARDAEATAEAVLALRDRDRARLTAHSGARALLRVHDVLLEQPIVSQGWLAQRLETSAMTAGRALQSLTDLGLVHELTGFRRNRRYAYDEYLALFGDGGPPGPRARS
jgi:Fic family protein